VLERPDARIFKSLINIGGSLFAAKKDDTCKTFSGDVGFD
jgi:hypothetical protein